VDHVGGRPRRAPPHVDALWGERADLSPAVPMFVGDWGMVLTGHGLEDLTFGGVRLLPRLFFTVRDQSWGSPAVLMTYGTTGADGTSFVARVEGYPLDVSGSIVSADQSLTVSFQLQVRDDVDVARVGPCVLHYVLRPGATITTDPFANRQAVKIGQRISSGRVASGYAALSYSVGATRLIVEFDGGLFEMEDQRNWTDDTFKSYTPPLSEPRPLRLCKDQVLTYAVRITAEAPRRPASNPPPAGASRAKVTVRAAGPTKTTCSLPEIGLAHPGGPSSRGLLSQLGEVQPDFVHLLADLGEGDWKSRLRADLLAVSRLGSMAVVTVDCPPDRRRDLSAFADIGSGSIDTAFLFDSGQPLTSDELADAGGVRFDGTEVRVGAGARGHFASLNLAGRVPDAAEVVGVGLAAAAHDDDRRALTTGLNSYPQIFRQVRQMAGGREIYAGPLGFAPTFDSWSPVGSQLSVREAWQRGHPRDRSVFAAAWVVAAIGVLSSLGPKRVCISGAIGPTSDEPPTANAVLRALGLVRKMRGQPVRILRAGDRIAGLSTPASSIVAVMTDEALEIVGIPSPVLAICGTKEDEDGLLRTTDGLVPSPNVLSLSTHGFIDLVARRGA
jgi:D-apionolactonase